MSEGRTLRLVVCLDCDGHFLASKLTDRAKVFKMIRDDVNCGDAWANEEENFTVNEENHMHTTYSEFESFVNHFIQRGQLEIIDIVI